MIPSYAILFLVILLTGSLGAMSMIAYSSRRKKTMKDDRPLLGSSAIVVQPLNPEGTVIVRGELWNACSSHGQLIDTQTRVSIIRLRDHLLVVEDCPG
jgi:membrane-bound ClpP family serine protease